MLKVLHSGSPKMATIFYSIKMERHNLEAQASGLRVNGTLPSAGHLDSREARMV